MTKSTSLPSCYYTVASSPGHSQILSRSHGEKSGEGLGSKLRHGQEMVDSVSTKLRHELEMIDSVSM